MSYTYPTIVVWIKFEIKAHANGILHDSSLFNQAIIVVALKISSYFLHVIFQKLCSL